MENENHEIVSISQGEISAWDRGVVWVTDRVGFETKEILNRARKNYYGIFDETIDPDSERDKVWYPVTEWTVESVVTNVDLDTKDIMVRPKTPDDIGIARVARYVLQWLFGKLDFGQKLNDIIRSLAINGTSIVKIWKMGGEIKFKEVDILNFFIEPSASSIQEATSVIERSLVTIDEFKSMAKKFEWENTDIIGSTTLEKNNVAGSFGSMDSASEVPLVALYERHGKIRKSWLTKKDEDRNIWVDGYAIMSGLDKDNDGPFLHYITDNVRKNKDGKAVKPYEECWFTRVPGRWLGRGIPEKLFNIQENLNEIVNIRANNARILQNGLFEVRKGSGLTPEKLRISAGGVIPVTALGVDIKQLQVQDYRPSSYADQREMVLAGEKVTLAPAISSGQPTAASMPATNASIQDTNARSNFAMVQENIGLFIRRTIKNHFFPLLSETLKKEDIISITGAIRDVEEIDNQILDHVVKEQLKEYWDKYGILPSDEQIEAAIQDARRKMPKEKFLSMSKNLFDPELDLGVEVADETFSRVVVAQQLRELILTITRLPQTKFDVDMVIEEVLDNLGIDGRRYFKKEATQMASAINPPANMSPDRGLAGSETTNSINSQAALQGATAIQGIQQ